ncbi:MAG TPA: hypothetical protein VH062_30580 [Polyangiaceae bacterium]|nr:hypothetical protein [Polyangiaceae bacterium]
MFRFSVVVGVLVTSLLGCSTQARGIDGESHFLCTQDSECKKLGAAALCVNGACSVPVARTAAEGGSALTPDGSMSVGGSGGDGQLAALSVSDLARNQQLPERIVSDGKYVYWLNIGQVKTTDPKGPQNNVDGSVNACPVDGCGAAPTELAAGVSTFPYRIALSATAGRAFWTQEAYPTADGSIQSASTDAAGSSTTLYATRPSEIAAYGDGVYWLDGGPVVHGCAVEDCTTPLSFGDASAVAVLNGGIAVDDANVYWVDGYTVHSCPRSGCNGAPVTVVNLTVPMTSIGSLVVAGDDLYFATSLASGSDPLQGVVYQCKRAGARHPPSFYRAFSTPDRWLPTASTCTSPSARRRVVQAVPRAVPGSPLRASTCARSPAAMDMRLYSPTDRT